MSSQSKRIESLKKRFETAPQPAASGGTTNTRKRLSLYIDQTLIQDVDEIYRKTKHEVFPAEITKSAFLEQIIKQGLLHLDQVKSTLVE